MEICERTPRNIQLDADKTVACHLYYDHDNSENQQKDSTIDEKLGNGETGRGQ
jgi:hypothetical protein